MNSKARSRRAYILPWTLAGLAGIVAVQSQPTCMPAGGLPGADTPGGPTVINQTGRELSDEEIASLLANVEGNNLVVVFLSPIPGPPGPEGPQGQQGPAGSPAAVDPNLPQIGPLVGEVRMWSGSYGVLPKGWLACDGRALAMADYPELFGVLGTRWGQTEDEGLFRLPDFRDRSPMGASGEGSGGNPVTVVTGQPATFGGSATHTLTVEEMPAHHHDISHTHDMMLGSATTGTGYVAEGGQSTPTTRPTGPANPSNSGDTGGGQPHPILDPYFAITYIVFAGRS